MARARGALICAKKLVGAAARSTARTQQKSARAVPESSAQFTAQSHASPRIRKTPGRSWFPLSNCALRRPDVHAAPRPSACPPGRAPARCCTRANSQPGLLHPINRHDGRRGRGDTTPMMAKKPSRRRDTSERRHGHLTAHGQQVWARPAALSRRAPVVPTRRRLTRANAAAQHRQLRDSRRFALMAEALMRAAAPPSSSRTLPAVPAASPAI